jgi:hypothetical protein
VSNTRARNTAFNLVAGIPQSSEVQPGEEGEAACNNDTCAHRESPSGNNSLQTAAHAGSSLADFSNLKMEATYSSETLVH